MTEPRDTDQDARHRIARQELANRLFFRLYQCANMMHKTGTRALESSGVTTQQWAVLGALSRPEAAAGISVGDLAGYLRVSRQNLSGIVDRLEKQGYLQRTRGKSDARSRQIRLTDSGGELWQRQVLPLIHDYYDGVLRDLSAADLLHAWHYLDRLTDSLAAWDGNPGPADGGD